MSKHQSLAPDTLPNSRQQPLRAKRLAALELPPPSVEWSHRDVPFGHAALLVFKQNDIIEKTGTEWARVGDGTSTSPRHTWRTVPEMYAWIQKHLTSDSECPADGCHSTGVRNPRGREGYTCRNDDCTVTFGRDKARELME
jgi:hypothetical protein